LDLFELLGLGLARVLALGGAFIPISQLELSERPSPSPSTAAGRARTATFGDASIARTR
jgi:hypothetical protein